LKDEFGKEDLLDAGGTGLGLQHVLQRREDAIAQRELAGLGAQRREVLLAEAAPPGARGSGARAVPAP
jgi:hypothetical protein